ncbi:MAG TPA: S41 family peptidase, partial [Blastocatellia bacterium]|nr:S41 family peptidase [Blastocatellia bacterium]
MRKIRSIIPLTVLALTLARAHATTAQQPREQPDMTIDAATRAEVIDGVLKKLNDAYVFPEVAKKMEQAVRERVQKKEYDAITSASKFAQTLTAHLQEVSHDKHLRVQYRFEPIPLTAGQRETPEDRERRLDFVRSLNFGFEKVERLSGNIGYLDLRGFINPEVAGDTAAAAMNFLANTDALIIDLRNNTGGTPAMGVLLASYFFDAEPVHYADNYTRVGDVTRQWWTLPYVPG